MEKQRALFAGMSRDVLLAAAWALCAILVVQYFQLWHLLLPLSQLIKFTQRVAKGDLTQRAQFAVFFEFGQLGVNVHFHLQPAQAFFLHVGCVHVFVDYGQTHVGFRLAGSREHTWA